MLDAIFAFLSNIPIFTSLVTSPNIEKCLRHSKAIRTSWITTTQKDRDPKGKSHLANV